MNKSELRKLFLNRRTALSEAEYLHLSRLLCENFFFSVDLSFVRVLHTFLSITEKKEVDTWMLIDRIRREFPHIRLAIPRVHTASGELENFFFEGLHQLAINSWGIHEPRQGIPVEYDKIDMVLVPLLAFDEKGHRVGYGKGYYDKFLSKCPASVKKIGLSLFEPVNAIDDASSWDVPLDMVITPARTYTF
jgi:5-formyltetrahydrofolate cyclo-ligase